MKDKKIHKTSIGGQAVIEGVMMKGPKEMAIAVRKPDGEIIIEKKPVSERIRKSKILKWPLIRGCVGFFEGAMVVLLCCGGFSGVTTGFHGTIISYFR